MINFNGTSSRLGLIEAKIMESLSLYVHIYIFCFFLKSFYLHGYKKIKTYLFDP